MCGRLLDRFECGWGGVGGCGGGLDAGVLFNEDADMLNIGTASEIGVSRGLMGGGVGYGPGRGGARGVVVE